ncbi:MFS transporter [Mesorhizobium muleiense]|uniref:MFS transporter n=1 Tax=Mesorhizobium muleiense TaxID=1004279 RepID=UPI001F1E1470|nr:MFS transporter [Mesorhizobium muleiense]MCF6119888.1 MFS transporter [Mesorhizobium muleiense]
MARSDPSSDVNVSIANDRLPAGFEFAVACVCGAIVANLYFAQPIVGEIAGTLGLAPERAGIIVTLAQLGYCLGLLLLVPLADALENRRLALAVLVVGFAASITMALTTSPTLFLIACFGIGVGSVSVQILLPYAAALSDPKRQGLMVGRVMSGILTGIMLSRPVSSLITGPLGWRSVFFASAAICLGAAGLILARMPARQPESKLRYGAMLKSMGSLALSNQRLQRRAAYQFLMFYSYTLFWTALPLLLSRPPYSLDQVQIALVALAGAAGAIMSPLAGRVADRGAITLGTTVSLSAGVLSWIVAGWGGSGGVVGLVALLVGALLLDGAVPVSLVMSQRELFSAHPNERARLNGLFMAAFFVGGAAGASVGVWAIESFGWLGAVIAGASGPLLALTLHLIFLALQAPPRSKGVRK